MSDFSYFSLFTAGLACLIPFTAAYTQPVGASPEGNPISKPGLGDIVPVGTPYAITWDPTTTGTVTLLLLKGPSTNAVPQYPIVEKIPNTGSYLWTPATDLVPTENAQGYGIQLIVDATGQYQYTTQFGISNPSYGSSSSSMSSPATAPGYGSSTVAPPAYTTSTSAPVAPVYSTSSAPAIPTSYPVPGNSSVVYPTGLATSPSAWTPGPTSTLVPYTGSASTKVASFGGLVLAAGIAVLIL